MQKELGLEIELANSLSNLALLYRHTNKYSEAEPLLIQALDIFEKWLGIDHPNTLVVRKNLANLHDRLSSEQ